MSKSKKALILYWHGLGDVIMLTPVLRYLHQQGYDVHLMCRPEVHRTSLLHHCQYIQSFIEVGNPWRAICGFDKQKKANRDLFHKFSQKYQWSAECLHEQIIGQCKIQTNIHECGLSQIDKKLEIFVSEEVEQNVLRYIEKYYPDGYIFKHTQVEFHPTHNWDSDEWIQDNLPDLPIVDTGLGGSHYRIHPDINYSFVLAREAQHRVLSSSVFVHACEAMGVTMDVINYGRPDRKVWPKNQALVARIREQGEWVR